MMGSGGIAKEDFIIEVENRVHVGCDMPCTKEELEKVFDKAHQGFRETVEWRLWNGLKQVIGEKDFLLIKPNIQFVDPEMVIDGMAKFDCRPATHHELYAFCKAHWELLKKFRIVALGSVTADSFTEVVVMSGNGNQRYVSMCWIRTFWELDDRFLFVRK